MRLKYGKGFLNLDTNLIGKYKILLNEYESDKNVVDTIFAALENPIGTKKLRNIVKSGDKICLVVSDITRSYQKMSTYLPLLIDELSYAGIKDEDITILFANGAHRKQTSQEHEIILGDKLNKRFQIMDNDCFDQKQFVDFGITKYGTPIKINKRAINCDHLIITGAVTFHSMAGYGGGRKSIIPGIAAYESVVSNHFKIFYESPKTGIDPLCRLGNIEGNRMHLDMLDACKKIDISFAFNIVLDSKGNISYAIAGDYLKVHQKGREICDANGVVFIEEKADIVIASAGGYPKDLNLYIASKAHLTAVEALKEGGTMILLAECSENMGSDESVKIITKFNNNRDREKDFRDNFKPEAHSGYIMCDLSARYKIILVSEYTDEDEIKKSGMSLFRNLDEAIKCAYGGKTKENTLTYIMPNAIATLPKLK